MKKKVKKLVPELRFSEFEEPLNLKYLGEILDFKNGINADKSQYGSGKKFINVLDIINNAPIFYNSIIGSVNIEEKEFQKNNVKYGDILFQRSSEIREEAGQSNIYLDKNQEATFGGFVIRGRPKVSFNPIYFNYLLKTSSIRKEITSRSGGSTRFNVGQDSLSKVPISICESAKEQETIASFLDSVALRISQLRRKHELLETYKKGVMQKIFSQQIRFKQDNGKPFSEWKKKRLGELLTIRYGKDHKDLKYGKYPVLGTGGVMRYVDSYLYDKPSILIGRKGTIDRPKFVTFPFWTVDTLFYSEIKPDVVPFFLFLVVQSINWYKYNEATGVPSLNTTSINSVKVCIPSEKKEQEKIANFLTSIDKKIDAVALQIEKLEKFKKGLLQKMFV